MSDEIEIGARVKTPYGNGVVISVGDKLWVSLFEGIQVKSGQSINSVPVPLDCVERLDDEKKTNMFSRPRDLEE
tara:strand:- start:4878 stop:5099 length:222 start_codon:yes stop_codon:yes gene_type:complete